jgi:hypothetical protein
MKSHTLHVAEVLQDVMLPACLPACLPFAVSHICTVNPKVLFIYAHNKST